MHIVALEEVAPALALRLFLDPVVVERGRILAVDADAEGVVRNVLAVRVGHGGAGEQKEDSTELEQALRHAIHKPPFFSPR